MSPGDDKTVRLMTIPPFWRCPAVWLVALTWALIWTGLSLFKGWPVFTAELRGPDDYVRMVRVFDWLGGLRDQGYLVPRLGPPGGSEVAWARLVDWPLIALTGSLTPFLGQYGAAYATATIMPAVMLAVFLLAALLLVWRGLGQSYRFALPVALCLLVACLFQFLPGRVDHHYWQITLLTLSIWAAAESYRQPDRKRYPLLLGVFMGVALAIGPEIVLWLVLLAVLTGLYWLFDGRAYQRPALLFGAALTGTTVLMMLATRRPDFYFVAECDAISWTYIAFGGAITLFWGLIHAMPARMTKTVLRRLIVAAVIAAPVAGAILLAFPHCLTNPYALTIPALREIWLVHVNEAKTLQDFARKGDEVYYFYLGPFVLAALCTIAAAVREAERRSFWLAYGAVTVLAGLVVLFHIRLAFIGQVLLILPLCWGLYHAALGLACVVRHKLNLSRRQRLLAEAAFFVLMLGFFVYGVNVREARQQAETAAAGPPACDLKAASADLNRLPPDGVAAFVNHGAELLFRTHHRILSGSYHRNEQGIYAGYRIFTAPDDAVARAVMAETQTGLLLLCAATYDFWGDEAARPGFAERLWQGDVPDWLESAEADKPDNYKIFRVK